MSQDKQPAVIVDDNNAGKEITLSASDVELSQDATPFYIMIPAGSYDAETLTVEVTAVINKEEKVCEFPLPAVEFKRSVVKTLEKTFDDDEEWTGSTEATIKNVENVTAANDALQNNTGVDIADATGATESTPITVPAKTEEKAAPKAKSTTAKSSTAKSTTTKEAK
jgi:hypothetical protein